jgi:hypothetical protein
METFPMILRKPIANLLAAGVLMAATVFAQPPDAPPIKRCWQLTPMTDTIEWTPTRDRMTPYVWSAHDFYLFKGKSALIVGPHTQEMASLAGVNSSSFFGGHSAVLLAITWPEGHEHRGHWTITAGKVNPFTSSGVIEPIACPNV